MKIIAVLLALVVSMGMSWAEEPLKVDFMVLSVLVGPTKSNGKTWDASAGVNSAASSIIAEMVLPGSGVVASKVVSSMSRVAAQGTAAPEVIGFMVQVGPTTPNLVNVAGGRMMLAKKDYGMTRDSYTPRFQTGYSGWPVFRDTRFQIQLWDADLMNDDPISVVELTYEDLHMAIENGKATWINVADQSMNELLYVQISASKSLSNTPAKFIGYAW